MKKYTGYEFNTLERLFKQYQDENGRICRKDAAITKELIRQEPYRRVRRSLKALDEAETEADAEQIYKQFINW